MLADAIYTNNASLETMSRWPMMYLLIWETKLQDIIHLFHTMCARWQCPMSSSGGLRWGEHLRFDSLNHTMLIFLFSSQQLTVFFKSYHFCVPDDKPLARDCRQSRNVKEPVGLCHFLEQKDSEREPRSHFYWNETSGVTISKLLHSWTENKSSS